MVSQQDPLRAFNRQRLPLDQEDTIVTLPHLDHLPTQTAGQILGGIATPQTARSETRLEAESEDMPSLNPRTKKTEPAVWSDSLQTVLNQPPSALPRYLILGGFFFTLSLGTWAWVGRYQEVSRAYGRLVPQGNVYKVQAPVAGKVAQVLVQEGQVVQVGQTVMELDRRVAEAEVDRLEQSLQALQAQIVQTQGLIDRTRNEVATQRAIVKAEIQGQEATIQQSKANVSTSENLLTEIDKELGANQERLLRLQPLVEQGALPEEYIFGVESSLRASERAKEENLGRLQQAQGQLEQSLAQLNQSRAEAQRVEADGQQRLQRLAMDVANLQAKMAETKTLLQAARLQLDQLNISAPVAGTISSLSINNAGEVIQPSQTLLEIAPQNAPLVMTAQVPSRDAGLLTPGLPAQIKLDAFPFQTYGIVPGQVLSISPDSITTANNQVVFKVDIALDRTSVTHEGQIVPLRVGQTGQAEIVTRQKRIIDIVLDPIRQLKQDGLNL